MRDPHVLEAFNPLHGVQFFINNGWHAFVVLGAVFLVVTGGEALYADMGHFGRRPIRVAWFGLVLPSLVLNYLGQGAMLINLPETASTPFYLLAPALGALPARGAGDDGRDHRLAGPDLRRLLADAAGYSARLQPAAGYRCTPRRTSRGRSTCPR